MSDTQGKIIELLKSFEREGMDPLIEYMKEGGFFTQPASTRYHNCYKGGLAEHCLGVYELLTMFASKFELVPSFGAITLPYNEGNLIIAAILHDICKMGAYIRSNGKAPYKWNRATPKGHALLSLVYIARYIKMDPIEEMMIRFHMGTYGTLEFDSYCSEYPIRGDKTLSKDERYGKSLGNAWFHNPIVKLMYFCDELETMS